MFDIIIKNGTIIDGSGNPRVKTDLGIKQEKIEAIGILKCPWVCVEKYIFPWKDKQEVNT